MGPFPHRHHPLHPLLLLVHERNRPEAFDVGTSEGYMYVYICVCMCVYMYGPMCVCLCMHVCVYVCIYVCISTYVGMCICMYVYMYGFWCIYVIYVGPLHDICMCICMHVCKRESVLFIGPRFSNLYTAVRTH